eukprot:s995_g16.t1
MLDQISQAPERITRSTYLSVAVRAENTPLGCRLVFGLCGGYYLVFLLEPHLLFDLHVVCRPKDVIYGWQVEVERHLWSFRAWLEPLAGCPVVTRSGAGQFRQKLAHQSDGNAVMMSSVLVNILSNMAFAGMNFIQGSNGKDLTFLDQCHLPLQLYTHQPLEADCTFQIPNYMESLKLTNLAHYVSSWKAASLFSSFKELYTAEKEPSWEDKHGQSAVLRMAAEGLETARAAGDLRRWLVTWDESRLRTRHFWAGEVLHFVTNCDKVAPDVAYCDLMVRVLSFSGHILQTLPLSKFGSVGDFAEHVAALLNAPNCSLVGKSGVKFQEHLPIEESGLTEEDEVTAVAETLDPLLQMLELQDADGTLSWENLEELQDAALQTEQSLLECACRIGGDNDSSIGSGGFPCLQWLDKRVPPPPMFCEDGPSYCTLSLETPVIHGGARVLVFPDPSSGSRAPKVYCQETSMTIREVLRICRSRPDLELLQGELQLGEVLKPTISVTSVHPADLAADVRDGFRFAFDLEGILAMLQEGFYWNTFSQMKYANNGAFGAAVVEDVVLDGDGLGFLMMKSQLAMHLTEKDGLLVADLADLEQYKPLPGFAPLGGKATFQWKDGKLTTVQLQYRGKTYDAVNKADPAETAKFQQSALEGWTFAEKAIIASLLAKTQLLIHVKTIHMELAPTLQAVTIDSFQAQQCGGIEHPLRQFLEPFTTRNIQAANNNLKIWFEFRGAEFGLAPLSVEDAEISGRVVQIG